MIGMDPQRLHWLVRGKISRFSLLCKIVCALLSSDLLLDMRGSGQLHVTVRTGRHPLVELVICIGTNQPPPPTLSRHCHSTLMMGDRNKISQASNVGSRIATEK